MEVKDYYKTLGVEKTAEKDELKKQYRKLARKFHPDVNVTDKEAGRKFGEISEAYEVLSDEEKRRKYDAFGSDWEQSQRAGPSQDFDWSRYASSGKGGEGNPGQGWEDLFGGEAGYSEFFKTVFGQAFKVKAGARLPRKGQDLRAELEIGLEEAYKGGSKILELGNKKIRLQLKPGIWDRQTIRIPEKGRPGIEGGENGDLYIRFLLQKHPEYRLEGIDLFRDLELGVYSALLGTKMEIETISGKFELRIKPGTKSGTVFRLKGKGFPVYDEAGRQGDLFLRVALKLPERLTEHEKELVRELAELRNEKVGEETK